MGRPSGWLPHGRGQHTALRSLIGALHRRHQQQQQQQHQRQAAEGPSPLWVRDRTWIAAMDYDTGQRVLFGVDGAPRASLPDAVVASCSVPGWYERPLSAAAATWTAACGPRPR